MAKKVFIGVGHGGSDPGAVANGFKEADLNLTIATACNVTLAYHGVETRMSRTKNENDTLSEEIKECNAYNPDLAIDIHNNAGGGDGAEAFCHIGGGLSRTMAENVLAEIVKIGQNSRGVKTRANSSGTDYYGFIRETKAPACIVETAFVDNKTDMQIIDTEAEQKAMGVAIAKGILKTLGITYKEESSKAAVATGVITGVDIGRGENALILYKKGAKGDGKTGTNKWGTEVALDKNFTATAAPVYGVGNMAIPGDGYVLSGHGKNSDWLLKSIKKGDKLKITVSE